MTENNEQSDTHGYEVKLPKAQVEVVSRAVESAKRALANVMPNISYTHELAKSLPKIKTPALDNLILPPTSVLRIDTDNALRAFGSMDIPSHAQAALKEQTKAIDSLIKSLSKDWFKQIAEIAKNAQKFVARSFPPNWTDGQTLFITPTDLETMLLDEGLALAWVPPHSVTEKLFAANDATQRRKILFNNRRGIINACLTELRAIDEPKLKEYVDFAIESAETIQSGRWRASQALSTNLIDSIILRLFDSQSKSTLTNQKQRIDWKSYPIREAVVFGGIWGSYSRYQPGDANIPRKYTRHASAHAVSNRQYTKINALIAIMHLTAFIKLISEDFIDD